MKKRTKKVLSFGVAALMAVSALPFSALSVSASIPTKQTENGGTPYNFLLEEQGSGVQTISISKDEIAAGDVTKTLDVFIDSEEWPDDNYLSSVKLNWVATKDATFADGGAIANGIYYQNVFNASKKVNQHDVTMPNGLGTIVGTPYSGAFCMSPMFEEDEDLHTWSYNDAQSNGVIREIACDKIFGANLIANGDNKVKFEYDYYANADDYLADKDADKATHKSHKVQECDVKQKEDGTPYIEYSYINPGGEVAANYVEKTVTVDLPCYSTTRFVKDDKGNDCVPDINNYYSWGFIAASPDDRTYFVGGKSTDLRFTSFDVVVPKDTAEGTYYVQICSRNANKDLIPMPSAADFDSVKADQENYRATVGPLEDMSTAIQGKKDAATYALPQDPSKAIVKIVVGDGTVTDTTTTAAETTTTENSTTAATTAATTVTTDDKSDEFAWKIGEVACEPGDKKVKLNGTSYKVEQTVGGTENNKAAIVTYAQSNENVELVSGTDASLVDLAAKVDKSASIDAHIAASTIKLIDNDGNGKVDAAVYTPAKVGKVNTVSKSAIAVTQGVGTVKFDDYTIYDGVKKNDYVSVVADTYTSDDNGVVTKLDVVSGKIDGARTHEVKINGTWYKVASTAPNMATGDSYDVAIVGGVVVFGEMTAESSKNVMAITGVKTKAGATPNSTVYNLENEVGDNDKYLKVKAYFADGTSSEIKISKINGTKLNNLTVATGSTLEATVAQTIAVANLYTYSKLSDGMYDVKLLSSTNKAGYDVVGNGNYSKQKIDSKTLADDAVVFVIATNETKVMTGKQIKDWPDSANFSSMYAATESNGINYIKVAAIKGNTTTPNADGDLKYAYVVANSYTSKVEGEDGNKTAYDVWTADGAKTLYVDGTGTTVASGSILVYKEDGKYITITDSFKPSNGSYAQANATAKIRIDTVAITGFDYKSEGTLAIAKDASSTIPTDLTLDKDCVFIAVNSKDEEGMEGGMEGVQFANPGKVDSSKYIPNAIVVTDSDDDNNVLAVIYDANDIDWNDGLKDASNNPAEF